MTPVPQTASAANTVPLLRATSRDALHEFLVLTLGV